MIDTVAKEDQAKIGLVDQALANTPSKADTSTEVKKGILMQPQVRHSVVPLSANLGSKRVKFND